MSLIARASSTLSSSATESPGKKSYESQSPWSAKAEKIDRTELPVVDCHKQFIESSYSARYSRWDDNKAWSSQEWKADEVMDDRTGQRVVTSWAKTHESQSSFSHEKKQHVILEEEENHDRTGQPVVYAQREARPQQFIIGDDETESELSVESRSFLNRVNDQVRKRQNDLRSMLQKWINGQKITFHLKRDSDTMRHGELRFHRGSRIVNEFVLQFSSFNFKDTFKTRRGLVSHLLQACLLHHP